MIHKLNRLSIGIFFLFAGINHFINPEFYLPLIPPFFPFPQTINVLSGLIEIVLGLGIFFKQTRKFAAYGIIGLMVLFIPAHVYFIQIDSCIPGGLCVPEWIGMMRLVIIHPLLILWAYSNRI